MWVGNRVGWFSVRLPVRKPAIIKAQSGASIDATKQSGGYGVFTGDFRRRETTDDNLVILVIVCSVIL
jgi:hypothetical protein